MNIITIFLKELLQDIRDIKTMVLMILMPTIFTIILSLVVDNDIYNKLNFHDIKVYYIYSEEIEDTVNVLKSLNINCIEGAYKDDGTILTINSEGKIILDSSLKNKEEGKLIKSILLDKMQKEAINKELYIEGLEYSNIPIEENIYLDSIINSKSNDTLNYYGITMVILTVMFGAISGAYKIIKENKSNTLNKIMSLPVSRSEIIIGKILGSSITLLIQIIVVIIISISILKVNWGSNIMLVVILLYLEGVFFISMGTFIGSFLSDEKSAWMIILTLIMTCGLLSGLFIPIGNINNEILKSICEIMPVTYENNEIFNIIYGSRTSNFTKLIGAYSILTILFTFITTRVMGEKK